jgi:hypothetical protein
MKLSLTLGPRRALTRSEARACLAANLALPGAGSLAAGRAVGYWQLAAAFSGMILTLAAGIPFVQWALTRNDSASDPLESLLELWRHVRWPLAGIGLFAAAILWALTTSLAVLSRASKESVPPVIK